ncbi:MAG: hypothetical protein IKZ28_03385 [Clostridia bacterium]|nr:hypothetical protein [Clostridia bacterium]
MLRAYNNKVDEITITQNGFDSLYMSYLYGKVRERFSFLPASCEIKNKGDCTEIAFKTEREYCPYVRKYAEEHIADVFAVGYKYAFFEKRLALPLLSPMKKRLLLTALVAADYREDKTLIARRLRGYESYCLDGVFRFRLQEIQRRWEEVIDYVPTEMGESGLEGFLEFLAEDGDGKIFLKNGKAYDEEYRPLTKSLLTGVETPIGEILLGGAERVYCFGETDGDTAKFLKKYYGEKAVFC